MTNKIKNVIIISENEREVNNMKTRGWYTFADGTQSWFNGLSAREKATQIRKHGAIIEFIPT